IGQCVQEEDRMKNLNGGSINYTREKKKKNFHSGSSSKPHSKAPMHQNQQRDPQLGENECHFCHKEGHYKHEYPAWLKSVMAAKGIPFDKDYAKKHKMR
ncbi:unnamed protein product, partial [Urochloa humidicola]